MDKTTKALLGIASVTVAGALAYSVSEGDRLPESYQAIPSSEIQNYDGKAVELKMVPYTIDSFNQTIYFRDGSNLLESRLSEIYGSVFRGDTYWDYDVLFAAMDSIEDLVSSKDRTPITVRGVLGGDYLNAYSVTTGDGTYSITDKFIGEGDFSSWKNANYLLTERDIEDIENILDYIYKKNPEIMNGIEDAEEITIK